MEITMVSACENCGDVELLEYHEWDQGNECGYLCEACVIQTKEEENDDDVDISLDAASS